MEETKPGLNWKRILITAIIVLITAGAVGGTTYYVLNSNFQKERDANEKALDDVKVQAKEKADETPATTTSTPTNTMKVPELGIQFTLPTAISDAYYVMEGASADFTTRTLARTGGSDCEAGAGKPVNAPLGAINLSTTPPPNGVGDITTGGFIKQINGKYLYYRSAQSICSPTLSNEAAQAQNGDMLRTALQNATAI